MNDFDLILNKTVYEASQKLGGKCGNFSESPAGKATKKAVKLWLQQKFNRATPHTKERQILNEFIKELK